MDVLLTLAGVAKLKWYWVVLCAGLLFVLKIALNAGWRSDAGLSVMPERPFQFFLVNLFGAFFFYGLGRGLRAVYLKIFPGASV